MQNCNSWGTRRRSWQQELFHVASGAVEETGRFSFGLPFEHCFGLLLIIRALQLRHDSLEVEPSFIVVAQPAPSVGQTCQQFTSRVFGQMRKARLLDFQNVLEIVNSCLEYVPAGFWRHE